MQSTFAEIGFITTPALFDGPSCDEIARELASVAVGRAGSRNLLALPWCVELVALIRCHPEVAPFLPAAAVAVQCTLFEKSAARNWLASLHQDLSIPVAARIDHPDINGWSLKEGVVFAQPPVSILNGLVALRLQLDDCGVDDGPLRVVPGSHRAGHLDAEAASAMRQQFGEVTCEVPRGAALLMRPLLLHASSKGTTGNRRRVLHFLFGPTSLPLGLTWAQAV